MRIALVCAAVLLAVSPPRSTAADLGDNAALVYWQAFASLGRLSEAEAKMLTTWRQAKPDAEQTRATLGRHGDTLQLLHKAAARQACDWGLDTSEGFAMLMPHLAKARQLARLACLRARARLGRGDGDGAVKDLRAVGRLAVHTGRPSLLISEVVQLAIQGHVLEVLADDAHRLTAGQRRALVADLARWLPVPSVVEGIKMEKRLALAWLPKALLDPKTRRELVGESSPAAATFIDAQLKFLEEDYDAIIAAAAKSRSELARVEGQVFKRAKTQSRPLTAVLMPATSSAWDAMEAQRVRVRMTRAALAHMDQGAAALKRFPDPHGDGPFAVRRAEGSFTLSSKLVRRGKPVSISFQAPAK